jgi:hypothetical protein
MKLERTFTVTCCDFKFSASYEYEALNKLMAHIRKNHPAVVKKLNKNGRREAMSQNGCGYFDNGKGSTGGWFDAQSSFREAWKRNALKSMLILDWN